MSLTSERMNELMVKEMTAPPAESSGAEEQTFLQSLRKDIAQAAADGYQLDVPGEWPDLDGGETAKKQAGIKDRIEAAKGNAQKLDAGPSRK